MTDGRTDRTVADIGEFGLIERLESVLGGARAPVGIGDDAAVLELDGEDYLLATTDSLVEAVHFDRRADPVTLGRRAMAVNVSDIAAMGGAPTEALVSLVVSPSIHVRFLEEVYRGIKEEAREFGLDVVGGNVARTAGPLVVSMTVLGRVPKDQVILRRGAQVGDILAVTGVLGDAASRLLAREHGLLDEEGRSEVAPTPRVRQARALAEAKLVHAMIDLSDGLASDLHHLAASSGVGAVLQADRLPIAIGARRVAAALDFRPEELALSGGEDYELLMALAEDDLGEATRLCGPVPLTVVGTVLHSDQGVSLEGEGGSRSPLPSSGWRHF